MSKKKNLGFKLKNIKEKELQKTLKKIKTKKSAGVDGLSQEQLKLGSNTLKSFNIKSFGNLIRT